MADSGVPEGVYGGTKPFASSGSAGLRLLDACFDDVAYARYLLQSRLPADRNIRNKVDWKDQNSGNSILHCLCYSDLVAPVKLLLEHNADPNIRNQNQETPLHWCAKTNATACAKVLLENQASINAQDNSGSTPLHYAAFMGNIEMVMSLLDRGADALVADKDGRCAIDLAAEGKSNATKAVTVVFLRHYNRLGLPTTKYSKIKPGSMSTMPSTGAKEHFRIPKDESAPETLDGPLSIRKPRSSRVFEQEEGATEPRTLLDEIRAGNASPNKRTPGPVHPLMSSPAAQSPQRARRASATSPSPPFHFGITTVAHVGGTNNASPAKSRARSQTQIVTSSSTRSAPQPPVQRPVQRMESPPPPSPSKASSRKKSPTASELLTNMPKSPPRMVRMSSQSVMVLSNSASTPSATAQPSNPPKEKDDDIQGHVADLTKKLFAAASVISAVESFSGKGRRFMSASEVKPSVTSSFINSIGGATAATAQNASDSAGLTAGQPVDAANSSKSGGTVASKLRRTLSEAAFPRADVVPFLPRLPSPSLDYLDVILSIEHCFDCHLHSDQSLRHDPKKYVQAAVSSLYAILQAIVAGKYRVRVFALRTTPLTAKRLGALEVTIAICLPSLELLPTPDPPASSSSHYFFSSSTQEAKKIVTVRPRWSTHKLFSKLATKAWPSIKTLEHKATSFLDVTIRDAASLIRDCPNTLSDAIAREIGTAANHEPGLLASIVHGEFKSEMDAEELQAVEASYKQWQERMKMPVQVTRDPLDVDIPSLFSSRNSSGRPSQAAEIEEQKAEARHPAGPYLDKSLAETLGMDDYERVVLDHFLVFDAR